MVEEKRIKILLYILLFIPLFFISEVKALTLDTQDITWYYRKTSNESALLNTIKDIDTPVHIVNGEYLNGFTTRQDYTFNKDLQYMITYKLKMLYYEGIDGSFRSDTVDRLISYSWVDSDFKLLNTSVNQSKYLCEADICTREFTISQQVLTLNSTSGIRFGVYTTEAKSIGFYSPSSGSDGVNMYISDTITIEDNSSSTIIDQNNQIIDGQNSLQNSITNTEDSINQNINDMEQSIVDSNKETQDVIKDQFNSCRESYNLLDVNEIYSLTGMKQQTTTLLPGIYTLSAKSIETEAQKSLFLFRYKDGSGNKYVLLEKNNPKQTFTLDSEADLINIYSSDNYNNSQNVTTIFTELMLNKGTTALSYEPYGEEICSNKLDEQNDKLNNIEGALTDDSPTDMSGLEDSIGWLPPGPVDSILNLPLALFNSLSRNLSNKTCMTVNLELPFVNKTLNLPCVKTLYDKIGITGTLFKTTGIIASCFILFNYLLALYKWVDDTLTLRENTMPGYYDDNWGGGA